ncbi:MAG: DNA replication and repair protein RecF [Prevotella sp.]|nr:DNA replication and repair protein RecF [Prevotella sp.]
MILNHLSILNYKNIAEASLDFSPNINCFIGQNGAGKTNVLDAIYFLSFCHSAHTTQDSVVIRHDEEFMVLEGDYADRDSLHIYCGMKRGMKKHFKRDKKEYKRLSEHIGLIPIVNVSPGDTQLIEGVSEERRRLMDVVIAQMDRTYIATLNRYNKALQQRNAMLRQEDVVPDPDLLGLWEEQMAAEGEIIYKKRQEFITHLMPHFEQIYARISGSREQVSLSYVSHCQRGPLLDIIRRDRHKDIAVGYSLHGIHRDDLEMLLDGHPMRREGSQGQMKTYVVALKLAQFDYLSRNGSSTTPLLLLDDIFDKLDASRVEEIISLVSGEQFGQIFITDTNRDHLDQILRHGDFNYRLFHVVDGQITQ